MLIKNIGKFGKQLKKNDFIELIKVLPFKYFTIMKKGENVIDYSFPLVKEAFNDFLAKKIILLLKMPVLSSKESTIGDILELNLENDLSSNAISSYFI